MIRRLIQTTLLLVLSSRASSQGSRPWDQYVLSPASRHVQPRAVHSVHGEATVKTCDGRGHVLRLGAGSRVSMDFALEVGGWISFNLRGQSSLPLSIAFAESPSFVRAISDDTLSTALMNHDLALNVSVTPDASGRAFYRIPPERFRGGFRFLTFNALSDVIVYNISCEIGFATNMADMRSSRSYFYTSDTESEVLNRIWYAGAYTVQTNIAPANTGRFIPTVPVGWCYNSSFSVANPALVDGAKRDRAIWPGDLGISGPAGMLAYGEPARQALHNSLETVFYYQNSTTGLFPFAGPATGSFANGAQSDTYHAWSLISMHDYLLFSGDAAWLDLYWTNITRGIELIIRGINPTTSLQLQARTNDWGRRGSGGFSAPLNALAYRVLTLYAPLSKDSGQAASWMATANRLKTQFNTLLWDADAGLYRDNTTTSLHPQDGNALAVLYNLTQSADQAAAVSAGLEKYWNAIGPVSPELPDNISPFISGVELLAHLHIGETARAMELMHRLWSYLLTDEMMTGSTFVEGLTSNGSLYYRSEDGYKYDASYTSHAHSWSAAPTTALVTGVLGLEITSVGGKTWVLRPHLGGLKHVAAGFETGLGWFEATVQVDNNGEMAISVKAPKGTQGGIILPANQRQAVVNGKSYAGDPGMEVRVVG